MAIFFGQRRMTKKKRPYGVPGRLKLSLSVRFSPKRWPLVGWCYRICRVEDREAGHVLLVELKMGCLRRDTSPSACKHGHGCVVFFGGPMKFVLFKGKPK